MATDEEEQRKRLKLVIGGEAGDPVSQSQLPPVDATPESPEVRRAVRLSVGKKAPEEHARINDLTEESGLPRDVVDLKTSEVDEESSRRKVELIIGDAPANAELMQEKDFAGVALGDEEANVETERFLGRELEIERAMESARPYQDAAAAMRGQMHGGPVADVLLDIMANAPILWEQLKFNVGEVMPTATALKSAEDFSLSTYEAQNIYALSMAHGVEETAKLIGEHRAESAEEAAELLAENKANIDFLNEKFKYADDISYAGSIALQGVESTLMTAPGFALSLLLKNPMPMMGNMYASVYPSAYATARAAGSSHGAASYYASIDTALEIAFEWGPLATLLDIPGAEFGDVKKKFWQYMRKEVVGEQLTTIGQSMNEYMFGLSEEWKNADIGERFMMQAGRQWTTFLVTLIQSGLQGGGASLVNRARQKLADRQFKAMTDQQRLGTLIGQAKASQTRGASPSQYRRLIQRTVEKAGFDDAEVYISYDEAAEWAREVSEDASDPFIDRLRQQLGEKADTKADVAVNAADFAAYGPAQDTFDSLTAHIKMDPDGVTQAEFEQVAGLFEKLMEGKIDEMNASAEMQGNLRDIYDKIRAQLGEKAGFDQDVADTSAEVIPAMLKAFADMTGKTPEQIFSVLPLSVIGADDEIGGNETLEQIINFGTAKQEELDARDSELIQQYQDLSQERIVTARLLNSLAQGRVSAEDEGTPIDIDSDEALRNHLQALLFRKDGIAPDASFYYNVDDSGEPSIYQRSVTGQKSTADSLLNNVRALQRRMNEIDQELALNMERREGLYDERKKFQQVQGRQTLFQDGEKSLGKRKTRMSMEVKRMAQMQVRNYGGQANASEIGAKELLQNSFDAVKDVMFLQQTQGDMFTEPYEPMIEIIRDEGNRRLIVRDNGIGMDEETLTGAMLTLGSSKKLNPDASGGFGLAKISFLVNAEEVTITTVRDGKKIVLTASGADIFDSLDGTDETALDYEVFETSDPSGTTVDVTFAEQYNDPKTRELKRLPFLSGYDLRNLLDNSPLFKDIDVRATIHPSQQDMVDFLEGKRDRWPSDVRAGRNFDLSKWAVWGQIQFPWGKGRILVSKEEEHSYLRRGSLHVLSNGIWQFDKSVPENLLDTYSRNVPYEFFFDIEPSVEADDFAYPFVDNRTGFTPEASQDLIAIIQQLSLAYATRQHIDETLGFGEIEYYNADGSLSERTMLVPNMTIEDFEGALNPDTGQQLVVNEEGKLILGDQEIEVMDEDAIKAYQPDLKDFNIPQDQVDPSRVMVHNNMRYSAQADGGRVGQPVGDRDFIDVIREAFPDGRADEYLRMVGEFFKDVRDMVVAMQIPDMEKNVLGNIEFTLSEIPVGISFDRVYYGVHIPKPFRGMFINPALAEPDYLRHDQIPEAARPAVIAMHMMGTMIHEMAHFEAMNHSGDFIKAMQKLTGYLNVNPAYTKARDQFIKDFEGYYDVYKWINSQYGLPTSSLANIGSRLNGAGESARGTSGTGQLGSAVGRDTLAVAKEGTEGKDDGSDGQLDIFADNRPKETRDLTTPSRPAAPANPTPGVSGADTAQTDLFEAHTDEPRFADLAESRELGLDVELGTETPTGEQAPSKESRTEPEALPRPETNQPLDEEGYQQSGWPLIKSFPEAKKVLATNLPGGETVKAQRGAISKAQLAARDTAIARKDIPDTPRAKTRFQEGFVGGYLGHGPYINPYKQEGYAAGKKFRQSLEGRNLRREMESLVEGSRDQVQEWVDTARKAGIEEDNSGKTIVSLFDYTGQWSQPWVDAGYHVINMDIKLGHNLLDMEWLLETIEQLNVYNVVGIIAAPPCDTFTNSGRQHWSQRHDIQSEDDVRRMFGEWAAMWYSRPVDVGKTLLDAVDNMVSHLDPEFYAMENPVGRIPKITHFPEPSFQFDPYTFGDGYTKATQLWGVFNTNLPTAPVFPTGGSMAFRTFGGDDGKAARSITPKGFSYAFFMANHKKGEARAEPLTEKETYVQQAMNHPEYRLYVNLYDRGMRVFGESNFAWAIDRDVMRNYGFAADSEAKGYFDPTDREIVQTHMAMLKEFSEQFHASWDEVQRVVPPEVLESLDEYRVYNDMQEILDVWLSEQETNVLMTWMEDNSTLDAVQAAKDTGILGIDAIRDVFSRAEESLSGTVAPAAPVQKGQAEAEAKLAIDQGALTAGEIVDRIHEKREKRRKVYDFVETFPKNDPDGVKADLDELRRLINYNIRTRRMELDQINPVTGEPIADLPPGDATLIKGDAARDEGTQVQARQRLKQQRSKSKRDLKQFIMELERKWGKDAGYQMAQHVYTELQQRTNQLDLGGDTTFEDAAEAERRADVALLVMIESVGRNPELREAAGLPRKPTYAENGAVADQPTVMVEFESGVVYDQIGQALEYGLSKSGYGEVVAVHPLPPEMLEYFSHDQHPNPEVREKARRLAAELSPDNHVVQRMMTRNEYKLHVPPSMVNRALKATKYQDFADWLTTSNVTTETYAKDQKIQRDEDGNPILDEQGRQQWEKERKETKKRFGGADFGGADILTEKLGLTPRQFWENVHRGDMDHVRSIATPSAKRNAMAKNRAVYMPEGEAPTSIPKQDTLFQSGRYDPTGIDGLEGQGVEPSDPMWLVHATRNELKARSPAELVDGASQAASVGEFMLWMRDNMYDEGLIYDLVELTPLEFWQATQDGNAELVKRLYRDTRRREMAIADGYPMYSEPKNAGEGQMTLFQSGRDRLMRAEQLGFNTNEVLYHATFHHGKDQIDVFDPDKLGAGVGPVGVWLETDPDPEGYSMFFGDQHKDSGHGVYPMYARYPAGGRVLKLEMSDRDADAVRLMNEAEQGLRDALVPVRKKIKVKEAVLSAGIDLGDIAREEQAKLRKEIDALNEEFHDLVRAQRQVLDDKSLFLMQNDPFYQLIDMVKAQAGLTDPSPQEMAAAAKEFRKGYDRIELNNTMIDNVAKPRNWVVVTDPSHLKSTMSSFPEAESVDEFKELVQRKEIFYQSAYHGSPFLHNRFSLDYIGSGEGNQIVAWGLYFAEALGVAHSYRGLPKLVLPDGSELEAQKGLPYRYAVGAMIESAGNYDAARKDIQESIKRPEYREEALQHLAAFEQQGVKVSRGFIYEVDIADEAVARMLNWETPLADQPEHVQQAFLRAKEILGPETIIGEMELDSTGGDFYRSLSADLGDGEANDKAASEFLRDVGIPGVRYLDSVSRSQRISDVEMALLNGIIEAQNEGNTARAEKLKGQLDELNKELELDPVTRNTVVFDADIVTILNVEGIQMDAETKLELLEEFAQGGRKQGLDEALSALEEGRITQQEYNDYLLSGAERLEAAQPGNRGQITFDREASRAYIRMLQARDKSTFLHESAHWYLEVLRVLAKRPDTATPELQAQIDAILKFLDIKSLDEITTDHHELFAETFEIYLREGRAPSHALRRAFQKFADWLTQIYQAIRGGKLDKETRDIFDRMLATNAEIEAVNLESNYEQAISNAAAAGYTEDELADFIRTMNYGDDDAREKLRLKLLKQLERRSKQWWKDETERERKVIRERLQAEPLYQLIDFLSKKDNRLDRDAVFALMRWGKPPKEELPMNALQFIASKGGIDRLEASQQGIDKAHWINDTKEQMGYKKVPRTDGKEGFVKVQAGMRKVTVRNPDNYPMGIAPGQPQLFPLEGGMSLDGAGELLRDYGYLDGVNYGEFREDNVTGERDIVWTDTDILDILLNGLAGEHVYRVGEVDQFSALEAEAEQRALEEMSPKERTEAQAEKQAEPEWKPMPRKFYGKTVEGGLNPELVAGQFGYESAVEMIQAILLATPLNKAVIDMAEEAMIQRHGNILNDGTLELEALAAAHNEQRGLGILKMLNKLGQETNKRAVEARIARSEAEDYIDGLKLSEISLPLLWRAEVAAAQEVGAALAEGNKEAAHEAAGRQYAAHLRWKVAQARLKSVKRIRRRFKQYRKTKYSKRKLNPLHTEALKGLAFSLEFDRKSIDARNRAVNARRAVAKFITEYNNDPESFKLIVGHSKNVVGQDQTSDVLNSANELRELTVGEIIELSDIAASIYAAGKAEIQAERDAFNQDMQNLAGNIKGQKIPRKTDWTPPDNPIEEAKRFGRMIMASHRKLESLVRKADGHVDLGPLWKRIVRPLLNGARREMVLHDDFYDAAKAIFKDHPGAMHFLHDIQVFQLESGKTVRMSLGERMAVALNYGNADNRTALFNMNRLKLTPNDVGRIINSLMDEHWDMVEAVWELIEKYRDQVAEIEVQFTGVEPKWVEPEPFQLESGRVIKGGYYPLLADRRLDYFGRSAEINRRADIAAVGGTTHAYTRHHHTKTRTGFAGHTIDLSMGAWFRHMDMVFHDLAFREPINEVSRIINQRHIREALIESLGDEGYRALVARVKETGAGHIHPTELQWLEKIVRHSRIGVTLGALGFSNKTMISQTFGMATAIADLGEENIKKGAADFMTNPVENARFIRQRSIMMRDRIRYMNRDAAAVYRQLKGVTKLEQIQEASFIPLLMGDYSVSLPVWWSAYMEGLRRMNDPANGEFTNEQDVVDFADRMVYRTQQSGLLMDLSAVETQNELVRVLSMMYSAFNAIYNVTAEHVEKFRLGKEATGRLAMNIFWMYAMVGIMDWLFFGDDFDEDDSWWNNPVSRSIAGITTGMMVGLRELSFYLTTGRVGETPLVSMIKTGPELVKQGIIQPLTDEEQGWDQATLRAFNKFASIVMHWPGMSGQFNRTENYVIDYMQGEIDDFSMYDAFVTGRDRSADDGGKRQERPGRGERGQREGRAERSSR